jgi:hypothetical protein
LLDVEGPSKNGRWYSLLAHDRLTKAPEGVHNDMLLPAHRPPPDSLILGEVEAQEERLNDSAKLELVPHYIHED